jgi:hypothetical protein
MKNKAVRQMIILVKRLFPVVTNLIFLLASSRALDWGLGDRSFLFFLIVPFSGSYHLCLSFSQACFFSAHFYHVLDFWTATLTIPSDALYFVRFSVPFLERWLLYSAVIVVGALTALDPHDPNVPGSGMLAQGVVVGASGLGLIIYFFWYRCRHGRMPRYDMAQLIVGFSFTLLSLLFFTLQNYLPEWYEWLHGLWHLFAGLGRYFIVGIRPPRRVRSDPTQLKSKIYDTNVLVGKVVMDNDKLKHK